MQASVVGIFTKPHFDSSSRPPTSYYLNDTQTYSLPIIALIFLMLPLEKKKSTHEKNSSSSPPRGDLPPLRPFYPATLCVTYTEVVQILIKESRPP